MQKTKCYLAALVSGVLLVTGILAGCGQSKKDDHLTVYLWENRLMKNIASYDVVSKYYSYAVEYYKDTDNEIQWLPICALPQTIIANKTLFDQYGIKVPENYEEYVQVCQQFYDKGIKPYSMDLAEDWSNQEIIQAAAIGEFTSLAGIDWRNEAETSAGEIKFDDVLWKRIFSETSQFLKDSHFSKEDINVNVNTGTQMFVEGKSAMFHGQPRDMQKFQDQMDAELIRIPYFSQTSDSSFVYMFPSLNIAFNKELEKNQEKLDTALDVLDCMISEQGQKLIAGGIIQFIAEESETNSSTYGKYHFIVSDNGMGMSADFKETIFDAFTRAESSVTNKIQGTGLGMAITKNLVESMGGTIKVESEPNHGSSFEVILNLKIVENRVVSSTEQIEMHETDSDILDGMRILCAEDNELNAEILMELLKLEGAECTICENGKRILEAFEQSVPGEYDMILMDVQMPVMNGYEATEAIRRSSHEQAKTIPIIAMTANAFSEDMQHSLSAGMNAHISKPVDMKLLKKTIRNIKLGREEAQFIDQ